MKLLDSIIDFFWKIYVFIFQNKKIKMKGHINKKRKYRIKNIPRFIASVLVLILIIICVRVVLNNEYKPFEKIIATFSRTKIEDDKTNEKNKYQEVASSTSTPLPTPTPTPVVEEKREPVLIVIDPGHGGRDPGICNDDEKVYEKDIVLDIALRMKPYLNDFNIQYALTREEDNHLSEYVDDDLMNRCYIANENNATLFMSIHVNGTDIGTEWKGTEAFYYGNMEYNNGFTSKQFSQIAVNNLGADIGIKVRGIKENNLAVLLFTGMPAILVETAFLTNPEDYKMLKSDEFKEKIAKSLVKTIHEALLELGAYEEEGQWYMPKE